MKLLALLLGSVLLAGSQFVSWHSNRPRATTLQFIPDTDTYNKQAIVLTAAIEQPTDLVLVSKAFPGYNIAPATWVGEIDGHPFSVQGDVEVSWHVTQAQAHNPKPLF